jgi:hypothetical protein
MKGVFHNGFNENKFDVVDGGIILFSITCVDRFGCSL